MANDAHDDRGEVEDGSRSEGATGRPPGEPRQQEQSRARDHRARPGRESTSDDDIAGAIEAWLARRDELDPARVQALVDSGVVVLLGEVPDPEAKRSLAQFLLTLRGVQEVHDQLLVRSDAPFVGALGQPAHDAPTWRRSKR